MTTAPSICFTPLNQPQSLMKSSIFPVIVSALTCSLIATILGRSLFLLTDTRAQQSQDSTSPFTSTQGPWDANLPAQQVVYHGTHYYSIQAHYLLPPPSSPPLPPPPSTTPSSPWWTKYILKHNNYTSGQFWKWNMTLHRKMLAIPRGR